MIPDNNILDTIVSVVLIFALLSILVSILVEWWNAWRRARAKLLRQSIYHLLHDPLNFQYGQLFYNHYLIEGLKNKVMKQPPQYISSKLFTEVLIDTIANQSLHDQSVIVAAQSEDVGKQYQITGAVPDKDVMKRFESQLQALNPSPLVDTLTSLYQKANGDYEKFTKLLSFWYDEYMDRVSSWYKTKQRIKFRAFGFVVALALNVDSLHVIKVISLDDNLRNRLVLTAQGVADNYQALADSANQNTSELLKTFRQVPIDTADTTRVQHLGDMINSKNPLIKKLTSRDDSLNRVYMQKADSVLGIVTALDLPVGWSKDAAPYSWFTDKKEGSTVNGKGILAYIDRRNRGDGSSIFSYLLGLAITTLALSFGAPFWFETLVKLINIRSAGKKPAAVNVTTKE